MMNVAILILLLTCVQGALITNDKEIYTIPLNTEGWNDYSQLVNKELGREIGLIVLDPRFTTFEELLRKHQSYDAIVIRQLRTPGESIYYTDGKGTSDLHTPVVEMGSDDFDNLLKSIESKRIFANLTFTETNPYIEFYERPMWSIMVYLYVGLLIVLFLMICLKIYEFGIVKDCLHCKYNKTHVVIYIILLIELISCSIKIINGINLNDFNLLYHYKITRVMYTIHIPLFIISHLLWTFWTSYILKKSKKLEEVTNILGKMKTPFIILTIILLVIESITLIGNFTFAIYFPYWSIFVIGFYIICAIGISIFYTVVFTKIILIFVRHGGSEKSKRAVRDLSIMVVVFDIGLFVWLMMLICQFLPLDLATKRFTGLIGFYGILIASFALVWSFKTRHKTEIKSGSTRSTTPKTKSASEMRTQTSSTIS